jgi:hypothetical protein
VTNLPTRQRPRGKLTNNDASAVNTVLNHLGVTSRHGRRAWTARIAPPATAVRDALVSLADRAHNGLDAGLDGDDVLRVWPRVMVDLEVGNLLGRDAGLLANLLLMESEVVDDPVEADRLKRLARRLRELAPRPDGPGLRDPADEACSCGNGQVDAGCPEHRHR